jgi:hypothetical protein
VTSQIRSAEMLEAISASLGAVNGGCLASSRDLEMLKLPVWQVEFETRLRCQMKRSAEREGR